MDAQAGSSLTGMWWAGGFMGPDLWQRRIGEKTWGILRDTLAEMEKRPAWPDGALITSEDRLAAVLTKACELGFHHPEQMPQINAAGTRLLWPRGELVQGSLTAAGMEAYYARRGHGFFLLRMAQLLRAC